MKRQVKITKLVDWNIARKMARRSVGKDDVSSEVSDKFKVDLIGCEHSPLRALEYLIEIYNMPVVISQQFTRHSIAIGGVFVNEPINPTDVEEVQTSQREDRTGVERSKYTDLIFKANAQGLIDMSKKRLCQGASKEAQDIWKEVTARVMRIDPHLAEKMQPTCIHIGGCPEKMCKCNWWQTKQYSSIRAKHKSLYFKQNHE